MQQGVIDMKRASLLALLGMAALILPAAPVRVQAPAEPAKPPPCPKTWTYAAEVDGAPDKGTCRAYVDQAQPVAFNIPPGKLFDALKAYLEQSGGRGLVPLDLMIANICDGPSNCAKGAIPTAGVNGNLPPREALEQLLKGTGVTFLQDQTGTHYFPPLEKAPAPGGRCIWDKTPPNACPGQ
jgi:hypothetical protein